MEGSWAIWGSRGEERDAIVGTDLSTWADLKYVRGMAHLESVLELGRSWDAGKHTWLDLSLSKDGCQIDGHLRINVPPPLDELSLRLGDGLHCLRGALDALTWELCHLDGDPKPGALERIQFPCDRTDDAWIKRIKGPLASMPKDFQKRIRHYQPIDGDDSSSAVSWLFRLNNQDKHRGAIVQSPFQRSVMLPFSLDRSGGLDETPISSHINFVEPPPFENGALVLTYSFDRAVVLNQTSTPVGLRYTVSDGKGHEANLDQLIKVLGEIGSMMEFIRTGMDRSSMPKNVAG